MHIDYFYDTDMQFGRTSKIEVNMFKTLEICDLA